MARRGVFGIIVGVLALCAWPSPAPAAIMNIEVCQANFTNCVPTFPANLTFPNTLVGNTSDLGIEASISVFTPDESLGSWQLPTLTGSTDFTYQISSGCTGSSTNCFLLTHFAPTVTGTQIASGFLGYAPTPPSGLTCFKCGSTGERITLTGTGISAVPGPTVGAGASSFALTALFLGWLVRRRGHQVDEPSLYRIAETAVSVCSVARRPRRRGAVLAGAADPAHRSRAARGRLNRLGRAQAEVTCRSNVNVSFGVKTGCPGRPAASLVYPQQQTVLALT
jgi:hypothetical protein